MTTETNVEPEALPDLLGMSDEEFLSQDIQEVETSVEETTDEQSEEATSEEIETEQSTDDEVGELDGSEETSEGEAETSTDTEGQDSTPGDDEDSTGDEGLSEVGETDSTGDSTSLDKVNDDDGEESIDDYKLQIEELFAPIKANGKDHEVTTIEQARKLMQMGMGYNKSMEAIKPARLLQKKMEKHGLLEEGRLDFLIALDKKNPEAIAQLLKDSGIDPLKIDLESDSSYQPEAYSGDPNGLALDDVIDEIRSSPHFDDVVELVTTKWDESSRHTLTEAPKIMSIINSHMENGLYDKISERVEQEKMLGGYMGVSDLQAYSTVAEIMKSEGVLVPDNAAKESTTTQTIKAAVKKKVKVDPNLALKKATAITKSSPARKKAEPDYLNMSDEDYLKLE